MATLDRSKKNGKRRFAATLAAVLLGSALLASCGGGDQKEKFHADRVIVFGDEASLLNSGSDNRFPRGTKFTINVIDTNTGLVNCALNPLWVQIVAGDYGHVFDECNPTHLAVPGGIMRAAYGAKVADIVTQIDAFVAAGGFAKNDLVTLMAGNNDLVAMFEANPRPSGAAMTAAAAQAGTLLGQQVLRLTRSGVKVLIATLPDLSTAPLGTASPTSDRALLNNLVTTFNDQLRVQLAADPNGGGRSGALLSGDDEVALFEANASNQFGFTDVVNPACTVTTNGVLSTMGDIDLPTRCTTLTANAAAATWLWAGRFQLSGLGHTQLGDRAVLRLHDNPL